MWYTLQNEGYAVSFYQLPLSCSELSAIAPAARLSAVCMHACVLVREREKRREKRRNKHSQRGVSATRRSSFQAKENYLFIDPLMLNEAFCFAVHICSTVCVLLCMLKSSVGAPSVHGNLIFHPPLRDLGKSLVRRGQGDAVH